MIEDTIRARSIELVNEGGDLTITLDGGGGDREPGIVIYGPDGPASAVTVRREKGMPYIMANTAAGTAVKFTVLPRGTPIVNLRDQVGNERSITP